ncbi:MAG: helix-turn-helix domain-containing protein [Sporichthyaceae bacterium]
MGKSPFKRTLVDLDAAAEYLGLSTRTVRNWIADGRLRGYQVGGSVLRVDVADVEALVRPIPTLRDATDLDSPCGCGGSRVKWFQRKSGAVCASCRRLRFLR